MLMKNVGNKNKSVAFIIFSVYINSKNRIRAKMETNLGYRSTLKSLAVILLWDTFVKALLLMFMSCFSSECRS